MVKRKVIEDSDDDYDIESPTKEAKVGDDQAPIEIDELQQLQPVKLKLNDVDERIDTQVWIEKQRNASKSISQSQPNAPATSEVPITKSRKAKTLTGVDVGELASASLQSSKSMKSFDSNDIFEFLGDDAVPESGPRKKRRRTESQLGQEITDKTLLSPQDSIHQQRNITQTSTIPTVADTSPFQVPSMSSYLNDRESATFPMEETVTPNKAVEAAEAPRDSFEDELAAAYPPSIRKSSVKPMILIPEHHEDSQENGNHTRMMHYESSTRQSDDVGVYVNNANEVHGLTDELGSDDQGIGVPREQYNPRPSRSRGRGRNRDEELVVPVDFSKRQEAVAKTKRKSKATKTAEANDAATVNQDHMAPEAPPIQPIMIRDDEEVEVKQKATEIESGISHEPQASSKPVKKQRGRPKKNVESKSSDGDAQLAGTKSISDAPESDVAADKKTKSKKSSSIVDSDSDSEDAGPEPVARDNAEHNEYVQAQPLQKLDPNSPKKRGRPAKPQYSAKSKPGTPEKKSVVPSPKGPDKHSPISKSGAVKFRVGLSKRARIEPLLRIVRK